jgi:hypothetical protein
MGEGLLATVARPDEADYTIGWSPRGNPAQVALLNCPIFEVFFGGARGGGKTDGMLGEWILHANRYGEHAIGLMARSLASTSTWLPHRNSLAKCRTGLILSLLPRL